VGTGGAEILNQISGLGRYFNPEPHDLQSSTLTTSTPNTKHRH